MSWVGIAAIVVGCVVLSSVAGLASGVDYDEIGDSTENVFRSVDISVALHTKYLVAVTTWLGWWRPAIHDDKPAKRWLMIVPIMFFVAALLGVNWDGLGDLGGEYLLVLEVGLRWLGSARSWTSAGSHLPQHAGYRLKHGPRSCRRSHLRYSTESMCSSVKQLVPEEHAPVVGATTAA